MDSIVRLKPTIMRKCHDISTISPYIFWRGWHSANFHIGYSCKRFLEHVFIYTYLKINRQTNWLLFAIFKKVFFLFGVIFNMTDSKTYAFQYLDEKAIDFWFWEYNSLLLKILSFLQNDKKNGKSRFPTSVSGLPVRPDIF